MRTPPILLVFALITASTAAVAAVSRDVLWVVTQSCVVAKRTTGRAFPCLTVELGTASEPGFAVLKSPLLKTEVVVMPTDTVVGIEAPSLQTAAGAAYWRAALGARHFVTDALRGRLALSDVAMAVNSQGGRSQDQLHIHLDCVQPTVRAALRNHASAFGAAWAPLPFDLAGDRYWGMRIGAGDLDRLNPFALVAQLPGPRSLRRTSFAVVGTSPDDFNPGAYLLAYRAPDSHAEWLLDHGCRLASPSAAE